MQIDKMPGSLKRGEAKMKLIAVLSLVMFLGILGC